MFLIRTLFWLTVLVFLIPLDDENAMRARGSDTAPPVDTVEAVGAAKAALDDVGGFCGRNPTVCDVGGRLATTFALKARTGAVWIVAFVDRQLATHGPDAGADTLTPQDLAPDWHGPAIDRSA